MPADSKEWLPKRPRLVKQSNISFKVFKSSQYSLGLSACLFPLDTLDSELKRDSL